MSYLDARLEPLPPGAETTDPADELLPPGGNRRGRDLIAIGVAMILTLLVLSALILPLFLSDPIDQELKDGLLPPSLSSGHLLGTDSLGRDQLSRLASGTRNSMLVCLVSVVIAAVFGTLVGTVSGYVGGPFDDLAMRVPDIQLSIPAVLLAITLVGVMQPSLRTVVIALSLYSWVMFARVSRAAILAFKTTDVVASSKAVGASTGRILLRHALPNMRGPMLALATVQFANLVIIESALGYLGLGIPPPQPTLGQMISSGQVYLTTGQWWLTVFPCAVIMLIVLCVNFLGDRLSDRFDPKVRR